MMIIKANSPKAIHVSIDRLRELFVYDPSTGVISNRIGRVGAKAGAQSTGPMKTGYLRVSVDGRHCRAHRLAWAIHYGEWPTFIIDHINQNKADNRIANLRRASWSSNNHNRSPLPNKFGFPGVRQSRDRTSFQSSIADNGKRLYLGSFPTAEEASAAYVAARQEIMSRQITALWRQ